MRQALALVALFGLAVFSYVWLGKYGAAGFGLGITATVLTLGLASGYWVGFDPQADTLVTELMRRLRERRLTERE